VPRRFIDILLMKASQCARKRDGEPSLPWCDTGEDVRFLDTLTDGVPEVPKGSLGGFWHFWHCLTPAISKELELGTNAVRPAEIRAKSAALVP
jgi:hypothetical protein